MMRKVLPKLLLFIGIALLSLNIYGLFQNIRPKIILSDELRFENDLIYNYQQALNLINKKVDESELDFSIRVTKVVQGSLAHIHWLRYEPSKFNQIVPIWENYFLYFMGKFSGIAEFERYHFTNYKRSLERGIGICGDASMVLFQVLKQNNIDNQIVSFPGHVIIETTSGNILDPDFGVFVPFSIHDIQQSPDLITEYYEQQGYSKKEINNLKKIYKSNYKKWHGVKQFLTKKYYFEIITYFLKWILPIILIIISYLLIKPNSRR